MFVKKSKVLSTSEPFVISAVEQFSLSDTFECGQAFRYELLKKENGSVEYLTVVKDRIIRVAQEENGDVLFYGAEDEKTLNEFISYFSLDTDYAAIKSDILTNTDSQKLKEAAAAADGIRILRQDPWEALFSFIISQNNNIPRIRKIIRAISVEYGENLAKKCGNCPKNTAGAPSDEVCRQCGICYSFPKAEDVLSEPQKLLSSKPGFRYKYLVDAAEKVCSGEVDLGAIAEKRELAFTLSELKKIKGVGDKVAACVALFGFENLDAFPIDVWMKRANEVYFEGKLDHEKIGKYAGIAQQYIFHYIRNLDENKQK